MLHQVNFEDFNFENIKNPIIFKNIFFSSECQQRGKIKLAQTILIENEKTTYSGFRPFNSGQGFGQNS